MILHVLEELRFRDGRNRDRASLDDAATSEQALCQAGVQPGQRRRRGLAVDLDRDQASTQLRLNPAILLTRDHLILGESTRLRYNWIRSIESIDFSINQLNFKGEDK